jgi:hypothetical protein
MTSLTSGTTGLTINPAPGEPRCYGYHKNADDRGKHMKNVLLALSAGIVSGFLSPLILSWLQYRVIWTRQKQLETKNEIFREAVRALSLWARDALDPELQSKKTSYKNTSRVTEFRPETVELLENSKGMIKALFSDVVYRAYENVLHAHIAIENVPNEDFEGRRTAAILAMAKELGIA